MTRLLAGTGLVLILMMGSGAESPPPAEKPRVPVGLAWNSQGIFVANRDGQSLIQIDPDRGTLLKETSLGCRAASLGEIPGGLVVGSDDGEVVVVRDGVVTQRFKLGRGPVRIAALPEGRAAISLQWSETVKVIDLATGQVESSFDLPFSPGAIVAQPDRQIIVADAFRSSLAIIDPPQNLVRVRTLDGANPRAIGLTPDGKELLVTHQVQYGEVAISQANLDWGLVLSSKLSAIPLSDLTAETAPTLTKVSGRRISLDGSGNGAADPTSLVSSEDGTKILIVLAGANQLMLNDRSLAGKPNTKSELAPLGDFGRLQTVEVGRSPVALALDPTGTLVATANSMDDTISIVKLDDLSILRTIALSTGPVERDSVARGEAIFRDGRRGFDRWMSCESCHSGGGHTSGLNFDTQGDGNSGAAKNTPSLFGVGSTAPYTWTGRFPSLVDQVHQSFQSSLRGRNADRASSEDVTAYLQSLTLPPAKRTQNDPASLRGAKLFSSLKCAVCHSPPTYTSVGIEDVGMNDGESGHTEFNPPSLRGVGRTAPYFHDGRAKTLDDVLKIHPPGRSDRLTTENRADLAAFLESL